MTSTIHLILYGSPKLAQHLEFNVLRNAEQFEAIYDDLLRTHYITVVTDDHPVSLCDAIRKEAFLVWATFSNPLGEMETDGNTHPYNECSAPSYMLDKYPEPECATY